MNKYEQLEEKILSMSFKEILLAMIDSIENPVTELDMTTFGFKKLDKCYGCAATNTICKIGNLNPLEELYPYRYGKNKYSACSSIISNFEKAIDFLRQGAIDMYNVHAYRGGFAVCDYHFCELPILDEEYLIPIRLKEYKKFAEWI